MNKQADVIIIGAGITGCAAARELTRYSLSVLVLEAAGDVACGATKANSGIVHAGFDAEEGSLKAKYNLLGNRMYGRLSKELGFPFKRNGSLVLAFGSDEEAALKALYGRGVKNGVKKLSLISGDEARRLEPELSGGVTAALLAETGGITSPYEAAAAFAENAADNGAQFCFGASVTGAARREDCFTVTANRDGISEEYICRVLINAAGAEADTINNYLSPVKFTITARRGEYYLYDKVMGGKALRTLFQVPGAMGKGVLVTPTVHGNLLIGPNATDIPEKSDLSTTAAGQGEILLKARRTLPALSAKDGITQFSGVRAHAGDDFIINENNGFINLAGIESPGLTAAPAIARYAAKAAARLLSAGKNPDFNPVRKAIPCFAGMTDRQKAAAVKADPKYGRVVCRCEQVTEAEIIQAVRRRPGAVDLDGVKRRVRAGMGRCQGGFCGPRLVELLARELGIPANKVTKSGGASNILICKNKETDCGGADCGGNCGGGCGGGTEGVE